MPEVIHFRPGRLRSDLHEAHSSIRTPSMIKDEKDWVWTEGVSGEGRSWGRWTLDARKAC